MFSYFFVVLSVCFIPKRWRSCYNFASSIQQAIKHHFVTVQKAHLDVVVLYINICTGIRCVHGSLEMSLWMGGKAQPPLCVHTVWKLRPPGFPLASRTFPSESSRRSCSHLGQVLAAAACVLGFPSVFRVTWLFLVSVHKRGLDLIISIVSYRKVSTTQTRCNANEK